MSSFHIINLELVEIEYQWIDDLVALLCDYHLLENAHNVDENWDKVMECVDTTRNESEKLNQNLLEKVDEGIAQASNALMILLLCYVTIICLKMHTM